ncbi:efflux RND transporter periplasmic adaptor subunit [Trinickia fusca]|uniref:Efflux RND transporter periplasmic adaptor subunit n=1 Tax=Trinickia fusca TaxID=2419777 RepID=A0A494XU69_9BURK|nr:efflux RND transporter periplasmic adaptor subunit [Trinickia fusca]RKP52506.1 efflux RND transporter periplasmic adaptor subunit [Trinickia fusca]
MCSDPDVPRAARVSSNLAIDRLPRALRLASACLAASTAFALAGCHQRPQAAPPAKPVVAVAVHPDGRIAEASLPGEIQARYVTPLSFRVGGKIVDRYVRLGDAVKTGQIVARLDQADAQKNLANAQAQFDAAQHRLVYAKQQLDRDTAQAHENLIAPAQLEQTQDAYAAASAQRDSAQSQLALAKDQLGYTTLTADHAGSITAEDADTGQNVTAGQAVYNFAWSGDIDVVCDAPERELPQLAVGRTATVTLPALPGKQLSAHVREVAPAADPQSRTYRVKLTLAAPDASIRLGMTANVAFAAADETAGAHPYTLPATALFHQGDAPAVWVVRAGTDTLELRPVRVARYDERTVSVTSGLNDGERVVLQGVHTVSAGQHVRAVPPLHPEDFAS